MTIDSIFTDADLLRTIPSGWNLLRLKDVIEQFISGGTPESGNDAYWTDDEDGVPWVAISDMTRSPIISSTEKKITEAGLVDKQLTLLPRGTLLFSIYASLGQIAFLDIPATTNQAILGLITSDKILAKYLRYWLDLIKPLLPALSSSNTQNNLNAEKVRNIPIMVPTLFEQQAITDYLDHETARLDSLIAAKERLLELLAEKRRAVIMYAVIRGLNPNVSLRDSGVEWLGEIPGHWETVKIKYIAQVGNGSTPFRDNLTYWKNGKFPWLTSTVVNTDIVGEPTDFVTEVALKECHLPIVQPNSVLVAITGEGKTRGKASILRYQATINQHLAFISLNIEMMIPEYLQVFLSSSYEILRMISDGSGSTKGALTCEQLNEYSVLLPPLAEQQQVVEYINERTTRIDRLYSMAEKTLNLLHERRTSLIAAAVSGQIRVV